MTSIIDEASAVWRARSLVWVLARREMAARNAGSAGGWIWSFAQPILTVAAYYLVFDIVFAMRLGENAPTRAVGAFLVVGALPWTAFCDAINRTMNSLIDAGSLLQRSPLPVVLFPVRSAVATTFIYAPIMLALALAYVPLHGFAPALVAFVPMLILQFALSLVLGYLLAILAAAMRDTVQIVSFILSVGIFLSPILFPITMFPEKWRWLLWINPMTGPVTAYQAILLQGAWPPISAWLVTATWILLGGIVLNLVVQRSRDQLVDWL